MNDYTARIRLPAGSWTDVRISAPSSWEAQQLAILQYGAANVMNVWRT